MNLSPTAYEALQRLRRAYVEAGPDGRVEHYYFVEDRACLIGRLAVLSGCERSNVAALRFHLRSGLVKELSAACWGLSRMCLSTVNDQLGFGGTVAMLDLMLVECAPLEAGVLEEATA